MMRRGPIVAAVAGVAVIILMVVGLILPKASKISAKQKEVAAAQQLEAQLQVQLQQLQADQKDAKKVRKELDALNQQVPGVTDLPGLIKSLNSIANQTGVDFTTISPGQPSTAGSGDCSIVPIQVSIAGGFFAIDQYLYEIETMTRVSKTMSLSLGAGPNGLPQLQAQATIEFYTTDVSAGPGSDPGHTTPEQVAPPVAPAPSPSPTTGG